jgi:hypothetical protein
MLACARDLPLLRENLARLARYSSEPWFVRLHSDGTLTDDLASTLPGAGKTLHVVHQGEADDRVLPLLKGRPNCQRYRKQALMGRKLVDAALMSDDEFCYSDSDILYFRSFPELFPKDPATAAFGYEDSGTLFSGTLRSVVYRHNLRPANGFNAGWFRLPKQAYDLDLVEWFLGRPELNLYLDHAEQTCFACLFGRWRGTTLQASAPSYLCTVKDFEIAAETLAVHYVWKHKERLARDAAAHPEGNSLPAIPFNWAPAHTLTRYAAITGKLRKLLG